MTGLENNKLVTVSASLGIPYTNGHRAEHDAAVAGEVFFEIRKELKARQAAAIKASNGEAA
jgi:DNA polymerase III alpha subunit (gram-positive type)